MTCLEEDGTTINKVRNDFPLQSTSTITITITSNDGAQTSEILCGLLQKISDK